MSQRYLSCNPSSATESLCDKTILMAKQAPNGVCGLDLNPKWSLLPLIPDLNLKTHILRQPNRVMTGSLEPDGLVQQACFTNLVTVGKTAQGVHGKLCPGVSTTEGKKWERIHCTRTQEVKEEAAGLVLAFCDS